MNEQFVEAFRYLRDHGKAAAPSEIDDFADLNAPMAPSKAHLKRLARAGQGWVPEPRRLPERSLQAVVMQDFYKAQMAQLGGTRTIASANGKPRTEYVYLRKANGASELGENR